MTKKPNLYDVLDHIHKIKSHNSVLFPPCSFLVGESGLARGDYDEGDLEISN